MTISITQTGRLNTEKTILATTSATDVYTSHTRLAARIIGIRLANTTGSAVTAVVEQYDATDTTSYKLTGTVSIAANASEEISFNVPVALRDNDEIRVTAGTGNALHCFVTALEEIGT